MALYSNEIARNVLVGPCNFFVTDITYNERSKDDSFPLQPYLRLIIKMLCVCKGAFVRQNAFWSLNPAMRFASLVSFVVKTIENDGF